MNTVPIRGENPPSETNYGPDDTDIQEMRNALMAFHDEVSLNMQDYIDVICEGITSPSEKAALIKRFDELADKAKTTKGSELFEAVMAVVQKKKGRWK